MWVFSKLTVYSIVTVNKILFCFVKYRIVYTCVVISIVYFRKEIVYIHVCVFVICTSKNNSANNNI